MSRIGEYYKMQDLVANRLDSPGKGGNISVKDGSMMLVKPSGVDLKDNVYGNLSAVNTIDDSFEGPRPTMEYAFHKAIKSKYVMHYHPVYLLPFLCDELFSPEELIIDYAKPGKELADEISKYDTENNPVIFLRNHGVIIHSDSIREIEKCYLYIKGMYFKNNINVYTPDDQVDSNSDELWLFREAMENIARKNSLNLVQLNNRDKDDLDSDPAEKYRKGKMK